MDQSPDGMLRLGLPVATLRAALGAAAQAGSERITIELPADSLRAALGGEGAGGTEVYGHLSEGDADTPTELSFDDADFDVAGLNIRW